MDKADDKHKSDAKPCGICGQTLNLKDRQPHLLPCLHSFCAPCLHDRAGQTGSGEFTCPTCSQIIKVPGSVSKFPVDPVRAKNLEYHQVKNGTIPCTECTEGESPPAESRCPICKLYLCKDCTLVHQKHRSTKGHAILTLDQMTVEPLASFGTGNFCPLHPAYPLDVYCNTCNSSCCASCMREGHKGHASQRDSEESLAKENDVEPALKEVQKHIHAIKTAKTQAEKHELALESYASKHVSEINATFEIFETMLKDRRVQILKDYNTRSRALLKATQGKISEFEQALAQLEEGTTFYAEVKETADNMEKIQLMPMFKSRFQDMTNKTKQMKTTVDKTCVEYHPVNEDKLKDLIKMSGKVVDVGSDDGHKTGTKGNELKKQNSEKSDPSGQARINQQHAFIPIGSYSIHIRTGDITKVLCDVVVSSAKRNLANDCGVALPIAKAAGQSLDEECKCSLKANGLLSVTQVVVTTAGDMPAKNVIHAARPTWDGNAKTFLNELYQTVLRCLCETCNLKAKSVAFPAVGTGMAGVPQKDSVKMFVKAVNIFSACTDGVSLKEVHLVDIDDKKTSLFREAFTSKHNFDPTDEDVSLIGETLKVGHVLKKKSK